MRSRAMRVALSAVALFVLGAAAVVLVKVEQRISERRSVVRAFDLGARELTSELSGMRAAQQAYVAAGQGVAYWIPEVASLIDTTTRRLEELRGSAISPDAHTALAEAAVQIGEFSDVDKRARDYLRGGEQLMAGDVVFTEGGSTVAAAAHQVEAARLAEQQSIDAFEADQRRLEMYGIGGAALVLLLIILVLTPRPSIQIDGGQKDVEAAAPASLLQLDRPATAPVLETAPRIAVPTLKDAATLCTDLGRVTDAEELNLLLGRAAAVMDASGVVVWLASDDGSALRPVLAHGYAPEVLAHMANVPRTADNAAAAAYRTGRFQIVLARPGVSNGAVVAPVMAPSGCIGALSAEMLSGSETSDSAQALAAIFAAQLAGVLGAPQPAAEEGHASSNRTAVG